MSEQNSNWTCYNPPEFNAESGKWEIKVADANGEVVKTEEYNSQTEADEMFQHTIKIATELASQSKEKPLNKKQQEKEKNNIPHAPATTHRTINARSIHHGCLKYVGTIKRFVSSSGIHCSWISREQKTTHHFKSNKLNTLQSRLLNNKSIILFRLVRKFHKNFPS